MPVLYGGRGHVGWLTLSRPQACNCWGEDAKESHNAWRERQRPQVRGA
ncbi:MAG: hypothetical protein ACREE2_16010 [Stellaceae bacterium]